MTTATDTFARQGTPSPADAPRRASSAGLAPTCASPRERLALLLICGVALIARLAAIVLFRAWNNPNAMEHRGIAAMLVEGHGFRFVDWGVIQYTSVQSPPFPFLLAASFKVFGLGTPAAYAAVLVLNALVGALTCAIAYRAVRAVGGTTAVALVTAALIAVWPTQVFATTAVQAITLITACTVGIVGAWYRSVETGRIGPWLAFGLVGCLAALTEPVLLPFMALSGLLILVWRGLPTKVRVRNAIVLFACSVLILGPWSVRNYLVHGKFVPVKSTTWVNMWKGNNEHASGTDRPVLTADRRAAAAASGEALNDVALDNVRQYDLLTPAQKAELYGKSEVEREEIFARYAKTFIREHPGHYARLCAIRFWKTVWVEADSPKAHGMKQYVFYWTPRSLLLILTPIGFVLAYRRGWRLLIPTLIAGFALLTHTLVIAAARFAFPYEPFQLALVALVIATAWDRLKGKTSTEAAAA